MRFSCERCGKKYATADTPAPGKVYKLKCKACGHLIVVRASAAMTPTPTPAPSSEPVLPEIAGELFVPSSSGELGLEIAPPEPSARREATAEVTLAAATPPPLPETPPELPAPPRDVRPPGGDGGYVDLFSDLGSGASGVADRPKPDDPFLSAARASLPDGSAAAGAPDPLAPLREPEAAEAPRPPPTAASKVPVIPKPPAQKSAAPIALIGGGVAVLFAILAFVLFGSGKKSAAPPPPAPAPSIVQAQAQAPAAPAPPPPAAPAPVVEPPPPAPALAEAPPAAEPSREKRKPSDADKRREDRRREAQAARERDRAERDRKAREAREERDRKAREARAERERLAKERERRDRERVAAAAAGTEAEGGLTEKQIEAVLRSTKKAFDTCLERARGSGEALDGRKVALRLNIQPSGTVTYPTLDDVTLNGTDLGACLKSTARLMVFPKFKGDVMHIEVPLVMR